MDAFAKIRKALNTGDANDLLTAMAALAELERAAKSITLTSGALRRALEFADPDNSDGTTDVSIAWLENQPIDDDGALSSGYFAWLTECPEEGHVPIDLPNIRLPWTPDTAPPPAQPALGMFTADEMAARVEAAYTEGFRADHGDAFYGINLKMSWESSNARKQLEAK